MSRPKKRVPRVMVRRVEHHPRPFESPLRPHLETIRSLRRAHKTWQEIARILREEHGVKTSASTVHNFFKRVTERARKGKDALPLGYEEAAPPQPSIPTGSPQPVHEQPPRTNHPESVPDAPAQTLSKPDDPVPEAPEPRTVAELSRVRPKPPFNPFA
jgi:hypothetical protein